MKCSKENVELLIMTTQLPRYTLQTVYQVYRRINVVSWNTSYLIIVFSCIVVTWCLILLLWVLEVNRQGGYKEAVNSSRANPQSPREALRTQILSKLGTLHAHTLTIPGNGLLQSCTNWPIVLYYGWNGAIYHLISCKNSGLYSKPTSKIIVFIEWPSRNTKVIQACLHTHKQHTCSIILQSRDWRFILLEVLVKRLLGT